MQDPVVLNKFISDELSKEFCDFLDPISKPTPRYGMSGALGYGTSSEAAEVGKTRRAINGFENTEHEATVLKIEQMYASVQSALEGHFGVEMDLVNCNYQILTEGGENPMHSDSTKLDGSPWRDDGIPEELEYSALLYLNNYGEDFQGGEVYFKLQDVLIEPKMGQLLFFKGDVEHIHEVRKVTGGFRKNFVFFFGKRGNVSQRQFFND